MVYVLARLISPVRKKGPVNSAWFLTDRLSHCIYTFVLSIFPGSFFFKVGWKTLRGNLHCLCTHLSAFGGNIFVSPNPIDFKKVSAEFTRLGESKNFVVLATVCTIFGMYFAGLVFARRTDKRDTRKVGLYLNISKEQ